MAEQLGPVVDYVLILDSRTIVPEPCKGAEPPAVETTCPKGLWSELHVHLKKAMSPNGVMALRGAETERFYIKKGI